MDEYQMLLRCQTGLPQAVMRSEFLCAGPRCFSYDLLVGNDFGRVFNVSMAH